MSFDTFSYQPALNPPSAWEEALGLQGAPLELIARARAGLPPDAFERFLALTGVPRDELAAAIGTTNRTVARRKEAGRPLDPAASERLVRLAQLYRQAADLLGSDALAKQWMRTPRSAFAGATPFAMAKGELGAREVEDLLLRVERGVFY